MPLLLTAAAAATSFPILTALVKELWVIGLAVLGSLVTVVLYLRKESKEKRQAEQAALETRFKKVEEESHNNSLKHTSAQLEREKLVDAYQTRIGTLENKVSQVDTIASELNMVKSELKVQGTMITNMNANITEMKSESRAQFNEVLYLLKDRRTDK